MTPALVHCIYASTASAAFDQHQLLDLLAVARRRNAALGITGVLLHDRGHFFQVLEGEPGAVDALYARIAADPRHASVVQIIHEPIVRRSFAQWSMGFAQVSGAELADIEGLNDFFGAGHLLAQIDHGRARKLVQAFGSGRWHRRLGAPAQGGSAA
ncbi:MAG: hypothetical protein RL456_209 [Pseudomonadota bacterium]|jgi:hypothetical protein